MIAFYVVLFGALASSAVGAQQSASAIGRTHAAYKYRQLGQARRTTPPPAVEVQHMPTGIRVTNNSEETVRVRVRYSDRSNNPLSSWDELFQPHQTKTFAAPSGKDDVDSFAGVWTSWPEDSTALATSSAGPTTATAISGTDQSGARRGARPATSNVSSNTRPSWPVLALAVVLALPVLALVIAKLKRT